MRHFFMIIIFIIASDLKAMHVEIREANKKTGF